LKTKFDDQILLGIDYGTKRIGLAISAGYLARPYLVIQNSKKGIDRLVNLIQSDNVNKLVVGVPSVRSKMYQKITHFIKAFSQKNHISYVLWDETLTTVEAENLIKLKIGRRLEIDAISAAIILQSYLDNFQDEKK
jgi:putative Holliday junction resolvase